MHYIQTAFNLNNVCAEAFVSALPLQDDKDLVHEFVVAEGLICLIKVGAEADQNYQNYILRGTLQKLIIELIAEIVE